MSENAPATRRTKRSPEGADGILRIVIIVLVSAVIGLGALLGYSVWQGRQAELTATPAQRAIKDLEATVKKSPNSAAARVRLGEALAAAGQLKPAAEQLKIAVKLDKNHTGAYLDLGILSMENEEYGPAEKYFNKVVELTQATQFEAMNERREQALFHLGEIALEQRRYEDATGYFKGALRIRKDASDTYYLLAQSLRGMGEDAAAIKQLNAALAFDPNYPEAHYLYGMILLDQGDKINAAIHLRKAADLAPEQDQPAAALKKLGTSSQAVKDGRDQLEAGQNKAAIDSALLATALDPENTDAVIFHADALKADGDTAGAAKIVKAALVLMPDDTDLKNKLAELGAK